MAQSDTDRLVDELGLQGAASERNVAGVLFTYGCSIACRHCLFGCRAGRVDVVMTPEHCVEALELLHETGRVVHIAGGEAMLHWGTLRESLRLAHESSVAPHFIETNCSFAVNDDVARERFEFMAAHGVRGLLASADPYHQEFVPAERFLRVRRIAREVFGEANFWGSGCAGEQIHEYERIARDEDRLRGHVRAHPPTMVGAARERLAQYLDTYAPDDPDLPTHGWHGRACAGSCLDQFQAETLWELHIDPYGNIQTNCGMVLGRIESVSPAQLLATGPENTNRFVRMVCESGALGLARLAQREYGFAMPERVTQDCELCYLARRFLRPHHPDVFGPREAYPPKGSG